jgi:hypothetical protein
MVAQAPQYQPVANSAPRSRVTFTICRRGATIYVERSDTGWRWYEDDGGKPLTAETARNLAVRLRDNHYGFLCS